MKWDWWSGIHKSTRKSWLYSCISHNHIWYFGSKHFFSSDICTQFRRFLSIGSVSISISNCFDESFERRILSKSPSLQSRRFLLLFSAGLPTLPLAHATVTSRKNRAQIFLFLDPPATEDPIFFCILLEENVRGQHAMPTVGWGLLVWIFQWWLKKAGGLKSLWGKWEIMMDLWIDNLSSMFIFQALHVSDVQPWSHALQDSMKMGKY